MSFNNEQEKFWAQTYANDYIAKNSDFDHQLGADAWHQMLSKVQNNIDNYLECGCNVGRNIDQIQLSYPKYKPSIIEISAPAFESVTKRHSFEYAFNGAILDSQFDKSSFDLVFTLGVLIHIHPDQLTEHMKKMFDYSRKYILIGEYFNRTPTMIEYQGSQDKLFKRDFGKFFIQNFPVKLVDYGFLWGHLYDIAGFDDITWWLFEKQ
jgi:pseudaminic acid biosynthesis-associated methylase